MDTASFYEIPHLSTDSTTLTSSVFLSIDRRQSIYYILIAAVCPYALPSLKKVH